PASPTHRSSDLYNLLPVPCSGHQHPRRRATGEPDQENVYIFHNFKWHIVRLDRRRQRATGEPDQGKCVCYTQFSVAQPCRQPLLPSTSATTLDERPGVSSSTSSRRATTLVDVEPRGTQRPSSTSSRSASASGLGDEPLQRPPAPGSDNGESPSERS